MTTLTQPTLSILLDRLFAESDALEDVFRREMESLSPEQRAADRADYRQFYARLKDHPLPISRTTGKLLYLLARSVGARNIIEFGTSFGISTLHLAAALRDNGGGRLIGSEFEPSKILRARENLAAGGLSDLVEVREGDALDTLARDLPDSIDFVLLDGAKNLYPSVLSLLEGRLRAGALIVADNANASPEYLAESGLRRTASVGPVCRRRRIVDAIRDGGPLEPCRATCISKCGVLSPPNQGRFFEFRGLPPKRRTRKCGGVSTCVHKMPLQSNWRNRGQLRPILPWKHFRFVIRPGEPIVQMAAPCFAEAHANRRDFHETFFFLPLARDLSCAHCAQPQGPRAGRSGGRTSLKGRSARRRTTRSTQ